MRSVLVGLLLILTACGCVVQAQGSIVKTYISSGLEALDRADYPRAEKLFRAAIQESPSVGDSDLTENAILVAQNGLIAALMSQEKLVEAELAARDHLRLEEIVHTKESPDYTVGLNNLGLILAKQGKLDEAEATH
jgi:Tfp pilus assembly protein PilF